MGSAVVFKTPGEIPIQSFTTFGVNAKPNTDNPIGRFGTGLKYGISVLVRLGCNPIVWIGRDKYVFSTKSQDFRGKSFDFIVMRRERYDLLGILKGRPQVTKLPFTTEYGKDWEIWQAYREIESNTRDENGETYVIDNPGVYGDEYAQSGQTLIIIEDAKFVTTFRDQDKIFLPDGMTQRDCSSTVEVLDRGTSHVYFRGLRIADTDKPTLFTYNILADVTLTEDRTAKYDFQVREQVARTVAKSTDKFLIEKVLTADKDHWEHNLSFDDLGFEPTEEFKEVTRRRRGAVGRSAYGYAGSYSGGYSSQTTWDKHPVPWRVSGDGIFDFKNNVVLSKPYTTEKWAWGQIAQDIVDLVNEAQEAQHQQPVDEPPGEPAPSAFDESEVAPLDF